MCVFFFILTVWTDRTDWTGRIVFQKVSIHRTFVFFFKNKKIKKGEDFLWEVLETTKHTPKPSKRPIRPSVHINIFRKFAKMI